MGQMKSNHLFLIPLICSACFVPSSIAWSQSKSPPVGKPTKGVRVPFVGCASDGQKGPQASPKGKYKTVLIDGEHVRQLAYYRAEDGFGVLAPRGWNCFSTYGSNGSSLYVSPNPIDGRSLFSTDWKGFTGEVIQLSVKEGGTSGRFEVAKFIARVFPTYMEFVQNVVTEGIERATDFPQGPYPNDRLKYLSDRALEFETPPNAKGLGTDSRLQSNGMSIRGAAILIGEEPSLVYLSTRLSEENRDLTQDIIKQVEIESADSATQPN
jgi:hypothetical protein